MSVFLAFLPLAHVASLQNTATQEHRRRPLRAVCYGGGRWAAVVSDALEAEQLELLEREGLTITADHLPGYARPTGPAHHCEIGLLSVPPFKSLDEPAAVVRYRLPLTFRRLFTSFPCLDLPPLFHRLPLTFHRLSLPRHCLSTAFRPPPPTTQQRTKRTCQRGQRPTGCWRRRRAGLAAERRRSWGGWGRSSAGGVG